MNDFGINHIKKIALPVRNGYKIEEIRSIMYCESANNYTKLFFENGCKSLSTKTLKEFEVDLTKHGFYRIHKTCLVNLDYIKEYMKEQGINYVKLCNGMKLQVASRRRNDFIKVLTKA